jgi:hypothetical protein
MNLITFSPFNPDLRCLMTHFTVAAAASLLFPFFGPTLRATFRGSSSEVCVCAEGKEGHGGEQVPNRWCICLTGILKYMLTLRLLHDTTAAGHHVSFCGRFSLSLFPTPILRGGRKRTWWLSVVVACLCCHDKGQRPPEGHAGCVGAGYTAKCNAEVGRRVYDRASRANGTIRGFVIHHRALNLSTHMVDSMSQKVAFMSSIMATRPGKGRPLTSRDFDIQKDACILRRHISSRHMVLQVP